MIYGGHFDIDQREKELKELELKTAEPNFWEDRQRAENILKEVNDTKTLINQIKDLKQQIVDNTELVDILDDYSELEENVNNCNKALEKLNLLLLLNGPYDSKDCIVEIHSGAGGTEACDWANMIYRMYQRWCEQKKFKIELLDIQYGEEAGIKSVSFKVKGKNAYGYLKNEKGVHRLVRLSPFDSNNRRHTSFASAEITPEIEVDNSIEIDDKDLKIDVYRSTGAGGQGVNTTDSAVRITHLPTKIVVTCQNERSQIQNKEEAMKVLKSKLLMLKLEQQEKEMQEEKGTQLNIEFGSQIRSYIMHPYSLVKDHRTNIETSDVNKVLDGDLDIFIESNLKKRL